MAKNVAKNTAKTFYNSMYLELDLQVAYVSLVPLPHTKNSHLDIHSELNLC